MTGANLPQATEGIILFVVIIGAQALIWASIFWRIKRQRERIAGDIRAAGETLVLGPDRGYYMGWVRRFGFARTMGTVALTNRRLMFWRPLGTEISIPLSEIRSASATATGLGGMRHTFGNYLALTLKDGTEPVFLVPDQRRWLAEVNARLTSPV